MQVVTPRTCEYVTLHAKSVMGIKLKTCDHKVLLTGVSQCNGKGPSEWKREAKGDARRNAGVRRTQSI